MNTENFNDISEYEKVCEAVLFASGDPIELVRLAEVMAIGISEAERVVESLRERIDREERGIKIIRLEDSYQMCSNEKYASYIKAALEIKRGAALSQAALETLAVIAYNQPVTKAFADQVRGVDCGGVINTLVERGLVEEAGRLEAPGRPITYRTTENFLRCFSIESLGQLPSVDYDADSEIDNEEEKQMRLI